MCGSLCMGSACRPRVRRGRGPRQDDEGSGQASASAAPGSTGRVPAPDRDRKSVRGGRRSALGPVRSRPADRGHPDTTGPRVSQADPACLVKVGRLGWPLRIGGSDRGSHTPSSEVRRAPMDSSGSGSEGRFARARCAQHKHPSDVERDRTSQSFTTRRRFGPVTQRVIGLRTRGHLAWRDGSDREADHDNAPPAVRRSLSDLRVWGGCSRPSHPRHGPRRSAWKWQVRGPEWLPTA